MNHQVSSDDGLIFLEGFLREEPERLERWARSPTLLLKSEADGTQFKLKPIGVS
jgi:hypothetical protein